MPVKIKDPANYDWNRNKKVARRRKYPYQEWFNSKEPILLVRGTDFDVELKSMYGAIYAAAREMGYIIKCQTEEYNGKEAIAVRSRRNPDWKEPQTKAPAKGAAKKKKVAPKRKRSTSRKKKA